MTSWGWGFLEAVYDFLSQSEVIGAKAKWLLCSLQSAREWTIDFYMVTGDNMDRHMALASVHATDLSTASTGSTDHRRQCSPLLKHRPWTPSWPLMAVQPTDITVASGCSGTTDPNMSSGGSTGHSLQHGLWRLHGPWTSWLQAAVGPPSPTWPSAWPQVAVPLLHGLLLFLKDCYYFKRTFFGISFSIDLWFMGFFWYLVRFFLTNILFPSSVIWREFSRMTQNQPRVLRNWRRSDRSVISQRATAAGAEASLSLGWKKRESLM